jgi:hypothetical protein
LHEAIVAEKTLFGVQCLAGENHTVIFVKIVESAKDHERTGFMITKVDDAVEVTARICAILQIHTRPFDHGP